MKPSHSQVTRSVYRVYLIDNLSLVTYPQVGPTH